MRLRRLLRAGLAVSLLIGTAASLHAAPLPLEISAEQLLRVDPAEIVIVDIRFPGEKPRRYEAGSFRIVRLQWTPASGGRNLPEHARFFTHLKSLVAADPARTFVLLCEIGRRSAEAVRLAGQYGIRSRISHLGGGLEGQPGQTGLLEELQFQRSTND